MATSNKNAKSQFMTARVPHEVVDLMEQVRTESESKAQFIVTAMKTEIKRRQRKSKASSEQK
ncbi:YlcI/YnfO family protein [Xenorhabdus entomophaga]|uniref:YlcI/YnfO family protein n=1 Tax=Xenorhabdus entomophaga TaxID=3136257 RepID=UPI0030F3C70D